MLPLKIWNNTRNEKKLEAQQLRFNEARLAALTSQINPHFLFNTLNSVASLIRTDPDQARSVVYKLSKILRRLLRKTENLTPLREELAFIDDYLIDRDGALRREAAVRQGNRSRRRWIAWSRACCCSRWSKTASATACAAKWMAGLIRVRSRADGRLHMVVEDDGVGIPEARLATLFEQGIGVSNVNERLKVLYGDDYRMWIDSRPGGAPAPGSKCRMCR